MPAQAPAVRCTSSSCVDFTDPDMPQQTLRWLLTHHAVAVSTIAAYILIKLLSRLVMRLVLGVDRSSMAEYSSRVWDPVCLAHNLLSVVVGMYSLMTWEVSGSAATCTSLSDVSALVILLQAAHCISDFCVFLPQMIGDPVFVCHHAVLLFVSLVLPHCPGCYYVVVAFAIAELGSASIAVDAEWRKRGGASRGLKRVVVFGASRLINLVLLYMIWSVTPSVHEFTVHDHTDGALLFKANIPICFLTSVGGSFMMLSVNGLTWWRMLIAYQKFKQKRLGEAKKD